MIDDITHQVLISNVWPQSCTLLIHSCGLICLCDVKFFSKKEVGNPNDPSSVVVKKETVVVGNVPRKFQ